MPDDDPQRPVFGDPEWIERRGPVHVRKLRRRSGGGKVRSRFAPIWQRIEGEWTRLFCKTCGASTWSIVAEEPPFVILRCALGHEGMGMQGFKTERPED